MTSNVTFVAIASGSLAAHIVALIAFAYTRRRAFMTVPTVVVAALVLVGNARRLGYAVASHDFQIIALLGFEVLVLIAALWRGRSRTVPHLFTYLAFGLHLCAAVAAVVFALTLRVNQLV